MKAPKIPIKPYPPYKPRKPPEKITRNKISKTIEIDKWGSYTLDHFMELIGADQPDFDRENTRLDFSIEEEWGYYDDCTTSIHLHLYCQEEVDNPNLEEAKKAYAEAMKAYRLLYTKYKEKKKIYDVEWAAYKVESEKYLQEQRAKIAARKLKGTK